MTAAPGAKTPKASFPGDVVISDGKWQKGKTIFDVEDSLKTGDMVLKGANAVVVGRSNIVGKPMAILLLREHCTVTVCHSRTQELPRIASQADLLVAAVGRAGFVTADFIKPGAVVVDVGIHRVEDEATCRELFGDDPKRLRLGVEAHVDAFAGRGSTAGHLGTGTFGIWSAIRARPATENLRGLSNGHPVDIRAQTTSSRAISHVAPDHA